MALQMQGSGKVLAFDLAQSRVGLIAENVRRLGLTNVTAMQGDAAVYQPELAGADRVLCDVPCSGLGVLRRKPEVKEKQPEELAQLPPVQLAILENAARYVKQGGVLQYSTCTILPEENQKVVAQFLAHHPDFRLCPVLPEWGGVFAEPMLTLLPEICGSDGFFVAKMQRK